MNTSTNLKVKIYLMARRLYRAIFWRLKDKVTPKDLVRRKRLVYCTPRIVEYPFVLKNVLNLKRGRLLDVGCADSSLITELATLGFEVHGIDLRIYPVKYPNVFFTETDICKMPFKDNCFDVVVAVSTIEHLGITTEYWGVSVNKHADLQAIKEIIRIVKPNGKVLITVPYGIQTADRRNYRVYNDSSLKKLLASLIIKTTQHIALKGNSWVPVSKSEAQTSKAVILLTCDLKG